LKTVLRKVFGGTNRRFQKIANEELHQDGQSGDMMGGASNTHGRDEICIKILVGQSEGKISIGRPMRRWEDNIRWI
jgi:hypothetical protein